MVLAITILFSLTISLSKVVALGEPPQGDGDCDGDGDGIREKKYLKDCDGEGDGEGDRLRDRLRDCDEDPIAPI